uniref:Uncharacterized protein n=1 Tax=Anguilla anguilla TaxID=7936 RepID=A0A0E9ULZ1_ANGAN
MKVPWSRAQFGQHVLANLQSHDT